MALVALPPLSASIAGENSLYARVWGGVCRVEPAFRFRCRVDTVKVPFGYAYFGPPDTVREAFFNNVAPRVFRTAKPNFNNDPCGDAFSFTAAVKADKAHLDEINVPVLLVFGRAMRCSHRRPVSSRPPGSPAATR